MRLEPAGFKVLPMAIESEEVSLVQYNAIERLNFRKAVSWGGAARTDGFESFGLRPFVKLQLSAVQIFDYP